ncbi:MAG: lytic transglycosylase, partial [Deltaproteobacteria bacterium]
MPWLADPTLDRASIKTVPKPYTTLDNLEQRTDQGDSIDLLPASFQISPCHDTEKLTANGDISPQDYLDRALDLCQVSNRCWEEGDLEGALNALDRAYRLILEIPPDSAPRLLQQKDDLRVTISKRIIEIYGLRHSSVQGYCKAIPLVMNRHIRIAIKSLLGRERRYFIEAYKRSGRYRPGIVKALRKAGLPEELSWLPLIESGFKLRALSRARALGLWQFIASTGYKFGLKRTPWIDERMDPEKSTKAAIAYLKELHGIFGDWTTVLAAYNCGEGTVLRKIRSQRINYLDNFWDLYETLPSETASYVPKFLAVLHILNRPEQFRIKLPEPDPPVQYEEVTINRSIPLTLVARLLDTSPQAIKDLNPELRYGITPTSRYSLKVPKGKAGIFITRLEKIPHCSPKLTRTIAYRVRTGDSLYRIAKRFRTTVRNIVALNHSKSPDYLK